MTQAQQATFSKALTKAIAQNIRIAGSGTRKIDGARIWQVQGTSDTYTVCQIDALTLTCSCPAGQSGRYCKHRAIVTARLMEQASADRDLAMAEQHSEMVSVIASATSADATPIMDRRSDNRGPRVFR
jgi:hypothetical protein